MRHVLQRDLAAESGRPEVRNLHRISAKLLWMLSRTSASQNASNLAVGTAGAPPELWDGPVSAAVTAFEFAKVRAIGQGAEARPKSQDDQSRCERPPH